jgi:cytochrome c oxidase subunit 2
VRYPQRESSGAVVTANEIHVPVGADIALALTTSDVIHSFWVPSLAGKVDMVPGRRNELVLRADRAGVYRGQCAEFCGVQHALMALLVVAVSPAAFEAWQARESQDATSPRTPEEARGLDTFLAQGCGGCHTIRGTAAAGRLGPDLTHLGARRTLAAGTLVNRPETMAAWIADGHRVKPGNRMPTYRHLDPELVDALAAYLVSLK